jgi:hypothetical protein
LSRHAQSPNPGFAIRKISFAVNPDVAMAEFPQVIARKHSFQVAVLKANTFSLFFA